MAIEAIEDTLITLIVAKIQNPTPSGSVANCKSPLHPVLFVKLSVSGRISASLDTPGISILKNSQNPFSLCLVNY